MVRETGPQAGSEVSEESYLRLALEEPDRRWELHDGRLREKPGMSFAHNRVGFRLAVDLDRQLDPRQYVVGHDGGRLRRSSSRYYIPDVFVARLAQSDAFRDRMDVLEAYAGPVPLVVEVWSPSTGDYDVQEKLAEYQARGDEEIWRLHPFERTLTIRRRQPDAAYAMSVVRGGVVHPVSLPGVAIDLDALFALPLPGSR